MFFACLPGKFQRLGGAIATLFRKEFPRAGAWSWLQKLRSCTIRQGREKLFGHVEADEFYLGGQRNGKRGRGAENKSSSPLGLIGKYLSSATYFAEYLFGKIVK